MEFTIIILDIPQGAVTIASAIIVVFAGALVTFLAFIFRMLFSIRDRLKAVEILVPPNDARQMKTTNARMEILWELSRAGVLNLGTLESPRNPMKQERWNELTYRLHKDELSDEEAEEFLAALLRREEQAREEKDIAALAILGPGILLTKWQLKEKELREQK
jgi:hypothetical protein